MVINRVLAATERWPGETVVVSQYYIYQNRYAPSILLQRSDGYLGATERWVSRCNGAMEGTH